MATGIRHAPCREEKALSGLPSGQGKYEKSFYGKRNYRPAFALFTFCTRAGKSATIGSLLLLFPACKKRSRRNVQQRRRRLTDRRESGRLTGLGAEPQQAERSHSDHRKE
ncbi:MAG: hypothetical protein APF77_23245 [Clostridia bacterium BRH_c25]|nr:MAG: hypothetical protein APF77_23245 [Clostridia bacterium BRH_c25]